MRARSARSTWWTPRATRAASTGDAGAVRQYSEFFRSLALFGYFEGGKRLPAPNSGNILSCAFDSGWFWYIPLSPTLTSVGAVVRREMASKIQGDPEEALMALIAECPMISDYLRDAKRVTEGQYGELRVRKDYSYANTRFWCPGMVLIGDAACFVDPIFSSGVHLATYSALLAARSINSVLAGRRSTRTPRSASSSSATAGSTACSTSSSCPSTTCTSTRTPTSGPPRRSPTAPAPTWSRSSAWSAACPPASRPSAARSWPNTTRAGPASSPAAVDKLVANKEQSMVPLIKSSIVKHAMQEGAKEQARVLLGQDAEPDIPLFEGGLVPSTDGLSWSLPG